MPRLLYTLLLYLLTPFSVLRLLQRSLRAPAYRRRIAERFGFSLPSVQAGGVWLHAVSVGESIAAKPVVEALLRDYPELDITVSCTTPTGSEQIRQMFGGRVAHVYAPYDTPGALARFLQRVQPALAIMMETELWPNTVAACAARGIPVVLVNGRMSEKSARGYGRLASLSRPLMKSLTLIAAQTTADAQRFVSLGAAEDRVQVCGSIKFDVQLPEPLKAQAQGLRAGWQNAPVWIAASTHEGEDEIIIAAHQQARKQLPDLKLILVPRHPERFARVEKLLRDAHLGVQRRSAEIPLSADDEVLLGDTMGELLCLFGAADAAFVGGSLISSGGHNTLEPAAWGMPILTGPSDFNFAEISALLQAEGAQTTHDSAQSIAERLGVLLSANGAELRGQSGAAGLAVIEANRGALARQYALIRSLL